MKTFLDEDFLLDSDTAVELYHGYAKKMPIFDYHCHLTAREIAEDRDFCNMTDIWLREDHYKWRLMRANGVPEYYVTGEATDKEKFIEWAKTLPHLMGNPVFHWTYLELRRCFGIEKIINADNAESVWKECNEMLGKEDFSARKIIERFNVKGLCTTDDPVDDLRHHKQIAEDDTFDVVVLPTFRPDNAFNIQSEQFPGWLLNLEAAAGKNIDDYRGFLDALSVRIDYFHENGCRVSDHGLDDGFFKKASFDECSFIFAKRQSGEPITHDESVKFRTGVLLQSSI